MVFLSSVNDIDFVSALISSSLDDIYGHSANDCLVQIYPRKRKQEEDQPTGFKSEWEFQKSFSVMGELSYLFRRFLLIEISFQSEHSIGRLSEKLFSKPEFH